MSASRQVWMHLSHQAGRRALAEHLAQHLDPTPRPGRHRPRQRSREHPRPRSHPDPMATPRTPPGRQPGSRSSTTRPAGHRAAVRSSWTTSTGARHLDQTDPGHPATSTGWQQPRGQPRPAGRHITRPSTAQGIIRYRNKFAFLESPWNHHLVLHATTSGIEIRRQITEKTIVRYNCTENGKSHKPL